MVGEIPVTAVDLQRLIGHLEGCVGCKALGHGAEFGGIWRTLIKLPSCLAQEDASRLQRDFHVRELELQRLELIERFAEGFALRGILQGLSRAACAPPSEQAAMRPG